MPFSDDIISTRNRQFKTKMASPIFYECDERVHFFLS